MTKPYYVWSKKLILKAEIIRIFKDYRTRKEIISF